jgi:hypothetical protein
MLAAVVVLGALELSVLTARLVLASREERMETAALSSVWSEACAGVLSVGAADRNGWSVILNPIDGIHSIPVRNASISGRLRNTSVDISWRQWEVHGVR